MKLSGSPSSSKHAGAMVRCTPGLAVTENGVPVRKKLAPEICHPPSVLPINVSWSRKNGRS